MNRSASTTGDPSTLRERLVFLSDYTPPCNVRRKSSRTSASQSQSKLTVQDFVRMDPSYTTDIEHLVFPGKTPREQQQQQQQQRVASGKTRSRLAEMFALSRHLQQKSQDRESKMRSVNINRSVDSALDPTRKSTSSRPTSIISSGGGRMEHQRRWATPSEEPVRHQLQNATPNARTTSSCAATEATSSTSSSSNMSTARGPNVSILHLRSTSNPWDTSPTASAFTTTSNYRSGRNPMRPLTKHQSLVSSDAPKWPCASTTFHSGDEVNSADLFLGRRELSPVRWCDREVDGVYLGKSGWVQVQQRSLDESRSKYSGLQGSKRTGIKLANYHCVSEPGKCPDGYQKQQRPLYLTLREGSGRVTPSPSPPPSPPRSYSPPSLTPIISPPPAFQDKGRNLGKSRTFFGKTPFLPRSDAIVDSDVSPPVSPPKTLPQRTYKIPQTKSLEDTSNRRTQFVQRYGESSSSSSSSVGFRSLDSSRPVAMPRLSENTDSSLDIYEDADDEDNNSSSLATSVVSSVNMKVLADSLRSKEKLSPSNRNRNRQYTRKSPDGSGSRGVSSGKSKSNSPSSYSSSNSSTPEHLPSRRFQQTRVSDDGTQKVRRSRSLQLPERKPNTLLTRISPQPGDYNQRSKTRTKVLPLDEESVLREAEVVTEFLYGTRSRAAAQALLKHRYNNNGLLQDLKQQQKITVPTTSNGYNVFVVQNQSKPKSTPRGSISPAVDVGYSCCNVSTQMKVSQSYPTHQRSLDAPEKDGLLRKRSPVEQTAYHHHLLHPDRSNSSPSGGNPRRTSPSSATSSSSSDVWITATSDGASVGRRSPRAGGRTSTSTRGSTPLDGFARESVVTRPGSAPEKEGGRDGAVEAQQRSLSLPKSFLCGANTAVG